MSTRNFGYDASGNTLYDGNNRYWYDAEGQLCAVQNLRWQGGAIIQYIYDAEGARIGQGTLASAPSSYTATCAPPFSAGFTLTKRYLVDLGGDQVTELDGAGVWKHSNIWAGGKLVATYDTKGIHYELTDPLGTKRVQVNALGQVDETCTSLPFGNDMGNAPSVNCVQPGNALGTQDDATEHHFTQKERDTESGNDYFFARYYSSALGRFTTPDWSAKVEPVPYAQMGDPQSLNLYAYVRNNPLTRVDADGHCDGAKDAGCNAWQASKDKKGQKHGPPTASQIKKGFYANHGKAFASALNQVFGNDASKVPPQGISNAPKLDISKSRQDLMKMKGGNDPLDGFNVPDDLTYQPKNGRLFIAKELVQARNRSEIYKTYSHELANMLDFQINGFRGMENTYGNRDSKTNYGDPDTGMQVELKMFGPPH